MSAEPTLGELLYNLTVAVEDYRAATRRAEEMLLGRIVAAEQDTAALRDNVNESVTALSNRIEANTPAATAAMDAIFECLPDESGGVRDAD